MVERMEVSSEVDVMLPNVSERILVPAKQRAAKRFIESSDLLNRVCPERGPVLDIDERTGPLGSESLRLRSLRLRTRSG
jgi:hypothetical protein